MSVNAFLMRSSVTISQEKYKVSCRKGICVTDVIDDSYSTWKRISRCSWTIPVSLGSYSHRSRALVRDDSATNKIMLLSSGNI